MAHKKESARTPGKENSSVLNSTVSCAPKFCPREQRLLDALLERGSLTRGQADRTSGASNAPDIVRRLRQKLGHEAIETSTYEVLDRDGRVSHPGIYTLTALGRMRLAQMEVTR